jgi:L-serine dehydratase
MFLSVFDIFKIGIGPSSSHTMGPMVAASRFLKALAALPGRTECRRLTVSLHGSLAFTGKGHATDRAVFLGLMGFLPDTLDPDQAEALVAGLKVTRSITAPGIGAIAFDPDHDLVFDYGPPLPGHANGMVFTAHGLTGNVVLREGWYSIGGGFVVSGDQLSSVSPSRDTAAGDVPYPFTSAVEMLRMGRESGLSIAAMKEANERVRHGRDLEPGLERLQAAMNGCIDRGLRQEGILPGGLSLRRRAKGLHQQLLGERGSNRAQPHAATDWLLVYAMAVNEENAAGGRVVTAPTNGAAGVVPAVLRYYSDHCVGANADGERQFLLTAAAIGGADQAPRLDLRRGMRLPGRDRLGVRHGRGGALRSAGRNQRADRERGRNRARASSRHDLRPGRRPCPGALHRTQRSWRDQGGLGGQPGAPRRWSALHAPRQLHRDHAPDRPGHGDEI